MRKLSIKHARRRFTAARDEAGVPRIEASSWREALYGLGYMHALDRPTQMLFARDVASGVAAERIADKPQFVETDRFFRRVGLDLHLDREIDRLDDATFGQITAYCEGVNDGMKQVGRTLPMWATGFRLSPWNQKAVLLIGNLLSYAGLAVGQQEKERLLMELIQLGIADDKLRELFAPRLDDVDLDLLRTVKMSHQLSDQALELIADLPRLVGSNAWAVAPARSASGHALLAADPHLEVNRLPAIWYEAVLRWNDQFVMGATLPGCPLFAVARTERLAWGVTYLKGDTCDYFIEDCRSRLDEAGSNIWQYRRGDDWRDFVVREETIRRKGGAAESMRILETPQGILDGNPDVDGPGRYLVAAWAGHDEGTGQAMRVWLDVIACQGTAEAMDLVRDSPQPSLCWVFADDRGHIGMQASGWFPRRRKGHSGLVPVPAWDERNHWSGWIESYRLPRVYDPSVGFVATANEDVSQPGGPQLVTMPVPDYRKRRIDERLSELSSATLAGMQALQYDVVSLQAQELLPVLLPHLPDGPMRRRLANWDCRYSPQSREATLFQRLYVNVLLEVFGHEEGIGWRRMLYLCTRTGYSTMVLTAIDALLKREHSLWWAGRDKGELIRRAARRTERQPDQPWSRTNAFCFNNRFVERRGVGRVLGFHTSTLGMPGCHATVFQGHVLMAATRQTTFAPSYHFAADMGTREAWTNLPGGPSESRFSPYYKNDIPLWRNSQYKRLSAT